ncbi:MAG: glycosyltransferase, partial [Chitinophagaceae bacterium]|nr:glycosyltransferase [Chitinophagaceae bacterium]
LQLLGKLPSKEIKTHLEKAHIVFIPSLFDNLPYTVLETMSQGKVVLASKQGGHTEAIENGVDGFLFDHDQPSTFFDQLKHIMALEDDEIFAIGERARKKITDKYNYETIYEQKMQAIQAYLDKPAENNNFFPYIRPVPLEADTAKLQLAGSKKGLLSVVIPYYNLGDLLFETLDSVLASNYKNLEVIVIDDGSTDPESLKTLDLVKERYPQVKVIHKPNTGLGDTRNFGAQQATGEFMAVIDADDKIDATYYEKAVRVLEKYENVHFVGCWCQYFGNWTGMWPSFMPEPPFFLVHNTMNSSALIFKRASFLQAGNDPNMAFHGMEDWECIVNMTTKGLTGASLPEPLFHYRIREGSMFRRFTRNKIYHLHAYITNKHSKFYQRYTADIVNILNTNGTGVLTDNPTMEQGYVVRNPIISNRIINKFAVIARKNYYLKKIALKVKRLIS